MSDFELDITREHCPMTFVKTRLKLDSLPEGAVLSVKLKAGEPLDNVPKSAQQFGHSVLSIQPLGQEVFEVKIQKKSR